MGYLIETCHKSMQICIVVTLDENNKLNSDSREWDGIAKCFKDMYENYTVVIECEQYDSYNNQKRKEVVFVL